MSIYSNLSAISHFRKIKTALRHGRTPEQMFQIHTERKNRRNQHDTHIMSIANFLRKKLNKQAVYPWDNNIVPKNCHTIPLGDLARTACYLKCVYDHKKKNWNSPKPTINNSFCETINHGQYSSSCRYTRYSYTPRIESWGYLISQSALYVRIHDVVGIFSKIIKAPRGYVWDIDANGIRLYKKQYPQKDYHPTAEDILIFRQGYLGGCKRLTTKIENLYKKRKTTELMQKMQAMDAQSLIKSAEKIGCMISILDSLNSGNCAAGTINWIERHNLNKNKHYNPNIILTIDQHDQRVKNAVIYAITRHNRETQNGICLLSDHYLGINFHR